MNITLTEMLSCIPSMREVKPEDYKDGKFDAQYAKDLALAVEYNKCIRDVTDNLTEIIKQKYSEPKCPQCCCE